MSYSLPPRPPLGGSDIRFSDDTRLCAKEECVIEVMNGGHPVTLNFNISNGEKWELVPVIPINQLGEKAITLSDQRQISLDSSVENWLLRKSTSSEISKGFSLLPAHPNPFNPVTTIQFSIEETSTTWRTSLHVFDITGKRVDTLINEILEGAGIHTVKWNASGLPSGIYFIQFSTGELIETQKIVLMK